MQSLIPIAFLVLVSLSCCHSQKHRKRPFVLTGNERSLKLSASLGVNKELPEFTPERDHDVLLEDCFKPVNITRCTSSQETWIYNHESASCIRLKPGRCLGQASVGFDSEEACDSKCSVKIQEISKSCTLAPQIGQCPCFFNRYYYNPETKRCEEFVYRGCGGNLNRFVTEENCLRFCDN